MTLKWVADNFDKLQFLFLGLVFFAAWSGMRSKQQQTQFRNREADRTDPMYVKPNGHDLANAKMKPKNQVPLSLPGIRLTGEAFEILGVSENADKAAIMNAYKEKIKLFHPDRIQGQAREQIKFYEEASAKINQAKEEMLARLKK